MDIKIITFNDLTYPQLTDLHSATRRNLKNVDLLLKPSRKKEVSELTNSEWMLYKKHAFLTKLRLQIVERIFEMANKVKLQEVL